MEQNAGGHANCLKRDGHFRSVGWLGGPVDEWREHGAQSTEQGCIIETDDDVGRDVLLGVGSPG